MVDRMKTTDATYIVTFLAGVFLIGYGPTAVTIAGGAICVTSIIAYAMTSMMKEVERLMEKIE